jgi:transposase
MVVMATVKCTAEVLIAEIGVDMGVFRTAAHLASWAGLCS